MAGTTRDAIDTLVETEDGPMVFIDTAGMRRKGKIDDSAEYYSMVRALRAIDDADVALLVIDATEGVTSQDQRLAERVDASGCPILIVLNKWELVSTDDRLDVMTELHRKLAFVGDAPILKISALTGKNVSRLLPHLQESIAQYHTRVPTRDINKVIAARSSGRRGRRAPRCSTPSRERPIRPRSPCSSTARSRPPTCATSSARFVRSSASGPPRSRCACESGPDRALV